jgi:hypothetical protein
MLFRTRLNSRYLLSTILSGTFLFISSPTNVYAEDNTARIKTVRQAFTVNPGGRKRGELFTNAPVEIIEERGDWLKVRAEGWVRKNSVATNKKVISPKNATALNDSGFTLKSYKFRYESSIGSTPRMYVDLNLGNYTKKPIYRWRALLVAKDKTGKVLFSEPVTDDSADFKPGQSKNVAFYWQNGEPPYEPLKSAKDDASLLTLSITKVQLTQE